ncbi:MAG: hypothetical protein GY803_17815 [Chloroflexi bacterium]|nr:hypothetical protein [Chloroflexota bacterium]
MQRLFRPTFFLILFLGLAFAERPSSAQNAIVFESFTTDNHFPRDLTFKTAASSSVGEIVSAELTFRLRNEFSSESVTRAEIAVDPAERVELSYAWDTSAGTVPGAAVIYQWRVTDSAGNEAVSGEQLARYEDTRFDWRIVENEAIAVWHHDRPDSFGEEVFEIASRAVELQRDLFQAELDFQIRILIYNDFEEFAEWNGVVSEFVGGQAFPNQGVTAQIVSAYGSQERWLNDVVPHEVSHLYFSQVTFNRRSMPPTWLDEGLAQFNEFGDQQDSLRRVEQAAARGELLSLSQLERGFGFSNEARTRLAYAEAVSAVAYLVETYKQDGLADLLAAYKRGETTDEAFVSALGVTPGAFEAAWSVWLGLEPGEHATPTPWPLPTFLPSPTPFAVETAVVPDAPAATPLPPTPTPQPSPPTTPTPPQTEPILTGYDPMLIVLAACAIFLCCGVGLATTGALFWLWRRQSINEQLEE